MVPSILLRLLFSWFTSVLDQRKPFVISLHL